MPSETKRLSRVSHHTVRTFYGGHITTQRVWVNNPFARITWQNIVVSRPSRISRQVIQVGQVGRVTDQAISVRTPSRVTRQTIEVVKRDLPSPYFIPLPKILSVTDTVQSLPVLEAYFDDVDNFKITNVVAPFGGIVVNTVFTGRDLVRVYDRALLFTLNAGYSSNALNLRIGRHDVIVRYEYVNQETLKVVESFVVVPIYVTSESVRRIDYVFDKQAVRSESDSRIVSDKFRLTISFCEEGAGGYDAKEFSDEEGNPLQVLDILPSESFTTQRGFAEGTAQYPSWTLRLNNRFPATEVFRKEFDQSFNSEKPIPQHFYVAEVKNLRTGEALCFGNLQLSGEDTRFTLKEPQVSYQIKGLDGEVEKKTMYQGGMTITVAHPASLLRGIPMVDQHTPRISYENGSTGKGFMDFIFNKLGLTVRGDENQIRTNRDVFHFFELCELFSAYLNEESLLSKFGFLNRKTEHTYFAGLDQFGMVEFRDTSVSVGESQKTAQMQIRIDRVEAAIDVTKFLFSRHYGDPTQETPNNIGRRSWSVEVTRGLRDDDGFFTGNSANGDEFEMWWGKLETANELKRFFEETLRMVCDFEIVKQSDGSYSIQALWHSLFHDGKYYTIKRTPSFVPTPYQANYYGSYVTVFSSDGITGIQRGQRIRLIGLIGDIFGNIPGGGTATVRESLNHGATLHVIPDSNFLGSFVSGTLEIERGFTREFQFERKLTLTKQGFNSETNLYNDNGHLLNRNEVGFKPESRKAVRVLSKELYGAGNRPATIADRLEFRDDFQNRIVFQTEDFNEVRASYQSRLEKIEVETKVASRRWETQKLTRYLPNGDRNIYSPFNRFLIETNIGYAYPASFYSNVNGEIVFHKYYAQAYQRHIVGMNVATGRATYDSPFIISIPNRERINSTWLLETDLLNDSGSIERLVFVDGLIDRIRGVVGGNVLKMPDGFFPIQSQPVPLLQFLPNELRDNGITAYRRDGYVPNRLDDEGVYGGTKERSSVARQTRPVPIFDLRALSSENVLVSIYRFNNNGEREYLKAKSYNYSQFYGVGLPVGTEYKNISIENISGLPLSTQQWKGLSTDFLFAKSGRWHVEAKTETGQFYGFIDIAKGVCMVRRRAGIRAVFPNVTTLPGLGSIEQVRIGARFRASRSFTLAAVPLENTALEVAIEPDAVVLLKYQSATPYEVKRYPYQGGFNANQTYDIRVVYYSLNPNPNEQFDVYVNDVQLTNSVTGQAPDRQIGNGFSYAGFGITYDDNTLLYLDYMRVDYKKGETVTRVFDLSFPNIMGTPAESIDNDVQSTDLDLHDSLEPPPQSANIGSMPRVWFQKFYPTQAILEEENKAMGLSPDARGTVGSNGAWKPIASSESVTNETIRTDPFNDIAIINREFFEGI